jgi:hypothetical protein
MNFMKEARIDSRLGEIGRAAILWVHLRACRRELTNICRVGSVMAIGWLRRCAITPAAPHMSPLL